MGSGPSDTFLCIYRHFFLPVFLSTKKRHAVWQLASFNASG